MLDVSRPQIRIVALLFVASVTAILLVWFFFLRATFVPAYQNLRQSDASAIVREIDKAGIPYRLDNDGHDILVPQDNAAEARVVVAGSGVAMGGAVGFELFNDSDMGLTEFAQKINFQRALQGELSRTIMMSEGVEFARVHLALPERSFFRATQTMPTAAVTVQMATGQILTTDRAAGIRQLVAASVPGLSADAVTVLNQRGDVLTPPGDDPQWGERIDERAALERFYRVRARDALAPLFGDQRFEIMVNARRMLVGDTFSNVGSEVVADQKRDDARVLPQRDSVNLQVRVHSDRALGPDLERRVGETLTESLRLDRDRGDALRFTTGPFLDTPSEANSVRSARRSPLSDVVQPARDEASQSTLGLGVAGILIVVLIWLGLRSRRRMTEADSQNFADVLRRTAFESGGADAT